MKKTGGQKDGGAPAPSFTALKLLSPRKDINAMPTPIIPNACQVEVRGQLFGQLVENVWFVQSSGAPSGAEMETIAATFQTQYVNVMAPLSQDYSINEIFVKYLGNPAGPEFTLGITPAQTGGVATASAPGNVAFCVSLRTALSGRQFRGRKYFSGLPNNQVANNALNVAVADDIVAAVADMIINLAAVSFPLAVVSMTFSTVTLVTTALYTDLWLDSQRRRLTNRGA